MKLAERVHLVGSGSLGFNLTEDHDCHVYLVDGGDELALIDAGAGDSVDSILANVRVAGFDPSGIRYLLLTHAHLDHSGGARKLRDRSGLKVCLSRVKAQALRTGDEKAISLDVAKNAGVYLEHHRLDPCPVDIELFDGMELRIGDCLLRCIETPGHCDDMICFLMHDRGRSFLFSGDSLFYGGKIVLLNTHDCDLKKSLESVEKLDEIEFDALLPGHLCFSLKNGKRHVQAARHVMRRLGVPSGIV